MGIFSTRRRRKNDSFASRVPCLRWLGPGLSMAGLVFAGIYALSGKFQFRAFDHFGASTVDAAPVSLDPVVARPSETIRIATFNIRTFGEKKSSTRMHPTGKVDIMGTLAQIVSSFDLVAVQEVRSSDGTPIRRLIDLINASGGQFAATLSEPIGDNNYTESYAFIWNERRIRLIQNSSYVVNDDEDLMYREPMVASFQVRTSANETRRPFQFTAINAHTDPDEVSAQGIRNEINVLDDVFVRVRQYEFDTSREEDFIMMGDLNVGSNQLQEIAMIPNMVSVAGDQVTNTVRSATYDHILLDQYTTREYTGKSGVMDLQRQFNLTQEQALLISDHMPVWAEFNAFEAPMIQPAQATATTIR